MKYLMTKKVYKQKCFFRHNEELKLGNFNEEFSYF